MHPVHVQVYVTAHALDICNRIQHVHFVHTIQYNYAYNRESLSGEFFRRTS